ncbi:MAG: iron ABC transporter permease [Bacteroidales bacterium]|nr:iron ABC transporter permease [Bacteroidales bacterium]
MSAKGIFTGKPGLFIIVSVLLFIAVIWSASAGTAAVGVKDMMRVAGSALFPFLNIRASEFAHTVFVALRLPRILMAVAGGIGFAVSGSAMQGILRNPLVSPFTIGISSAAGFGAASAIVLNMGVIGSADWFVVTNSFLFAMLAAFLVYGIAKFKGVHAGTIILSGIAIMYFFSAFTSLLQYIAADNQLKGVVHWMFGNLAVSSYQNIIVVCAVLLLCVPVIVKQSWSLNALADGDETAISLGVNPRRLRVMILILSSAITAIIICFTGIIGFICLVAPHISRLLIGNDHRFLIPFSALVGALLLLAADTAGRTVISPVEIPVGIVTSFIGVPLFLWLLLRKKTGIE